MKFLATCTMLVLFTVPAIPAHSQTSDPAATADLSGLKDEMVNRNKALADKVAAEKVLLKKNAGIIQDAKKIDASNKKLEAERRQIEAQNAEIVNERRAMIQDSMQDTAAPAPAPPPVVNPARPAVAPAPVQAPAPHLELAGATVIPAGASVSPPPSPVVPQIERSVERPVERPAERVAVDLPVRQSAPAQVAAAPASAPASPASVAPAPVAAPAMAAAPAPAPIPTATAVANAGPMRVPEGVSMGLLLTPIRPVYPQIAQTARVEGSVILDAVISKNGTIESLRPVSGPEMLRRAAIDAVQTARYQPYRVNGENVQVATTITVVFKMKS